MKSDSSVHLVRVTERHIRLGQKADPSECPIALAVRDTLRLESSYCVRVGPDILVWGPHGAASYNLPSEGQHFISRFDAGLRVFPTNFMIVQLAQRVLEF